MQHRGWRRCWGRHGGAALFAAVRATAPNAPRRCGPAPGRPYCRHPERKRPHARPAAVEAGGLAAVSRRRSWLPAPESPHKAPRATPACEARDDLPLAHAVWRRLSGCCGSSAAGALSPSDHLFSEFPWSAGSEQATRTRHGGARRSRAACGSPWKRQAARRLAALLEKALGIAPNALKYP